MTDKQIIDKVNVKECKYYCNGKCERYEEFVEADYADYSVKCICEKENDLGTYDICDYQQLKRKEQECEELNAENIYLKDRVGKLKRAILRRNEQLDQLKAENEELKKEREKKRDHYFIISNENARLEDEKARLGYGLNCKIEKLKQTLTEIKEIAEPYYTLGSNDAPVVHILQKINECEVTNEV